MSELRFKEEEANEILRTAVRLAAPESLSFEDLARSAAQLGISTSDLERAEQQYLAQRTEAAQREQFRILQRNQFKISLIYFAVIAGYLALPVLVDLRLILAHWAQMEPFVVFLGVVLAFVGTLFAKKIKAELVSTSEPYQQAFDKWKTAGRDYLTPEQAQEHVDAILKKAVAERATRKDVIQSLRKEIGYDAIRATQILDACINERPELKEQLRA